MVEALISIILAAGIGLYHEISRPTAYELKMEDGSQIQLIMQKNSHYACPLYCEADHIHQALMCKDNKQINKHRFVYHITAKGETDPAVYCSIKKIISMSKLAAKASKNKLPDVVNASTEE